MRRKRLGDILIEAGLLDVSQLNIALEAQKQEGGLLGEVIVKKGILLEEEIIKALEIQLGIQRVSISNTFLKPEVPIMINEELARRHLVIPIDYTKNQQIKLAMADPLNIFAVDDVEIFTGKSVVPVIATKTDILSAIDKYYGKQSAEKAIEDFDKEYTLAIDDLDEETDYDIENAPVVRLVRLIIRQAVKSGASDIHIEPFETHVRVRYRIDGQLQETMTPPKTTHSAIITRIKIMGSMNIAEKRIPQDGRVELKVDNKVVDIRISVLPTIYGEKVVIRLLDTSSALLDRKMLGISETNNKLINGIIQNPYGIIIITGPTGSGKTTTLYTLLKELNSVNKNIITVEDPVEYRLNGINQVAVNNKAGMTFASALRAILRQDPDVIMIGEIRDSETAQIAVRSAITGHLVLSTMHTNDTASTVTRLTDMGIEPYLVSTSVVGVMSQRLVRRLCNKCKKRHELTKSEIDILGSDNYNVFEKVGCEHCSYTGYKGRIAIHEVMPMSKEIRRIIEKEASVDDIRVSMKNAGTTSLRDNCIDLVKDGITSMEELLRVTYSFD